MLRFAVKSFFVAALFAICSGSFLHAAEITDDFLKKVDVIFVGKVSATDAKFKMEASVRRVECIKGWIPEEQLLPLNVQIKGAGEVSFVTGAFYLYLMNRDENGALTFAEGEGQRLSLLNDPEDRVVKQLRGRCEKLFNDETAKNFRKRQWIYHDVYKTLSPEFLESVKSKMELPSSFFRIYQKSIVQARAASWRDAYVSLLDASADLSANLNNFAGNIYADNMKPIEEHELDDTTKAKVLAQGELILSQSVKLYPESYDTHHMFGMFYSLFEMADKAAVSFEKGLYFNPREYDEWVRLATSLENSDKLDNAIKAYLKAGNSPDPKDQMRSLNGLGRCYSKMKQYDDAVDNYTKAYNLDKKDDNTKVTFNYNIACIYSLKGDMDKCFQYLGEISGIISKVDPDLLEWAYEDPELENARKDPRFSTVLRKDS